MAMVISTRAKLVITALILFFLLGIVLVTGSTKGWFIPQRFNGERVAARIQVTTNITLPGGATSLPLKIKETALSPAHSLSSN